MKKKYFICFILLLCVCLTSIFNNMSSSYALSMKDKKLSDLSAKAMFLMDYNTGTMLYEHNSQEKMPVASIVKLMTIHLTFKEIEEGRLKLDDNILVSEKASGMGGSQVFIEANANYSVNDLIKSSIVSSANDASVALAEKIAGSEDEFVRLMNEEAKRLGLTNTNYINCTGLPASNQFSCARDTALLLREVTKHKDYHRYSTIWIDKLQHPKGRESELVNTNKLIRYFEGCDGGKTGSTSEAGYCLVATAKRGDLRLIGSVLGAENGKARFAETSQLLNYGFSNFESRKFIDSSKNLENLIKVMSGKENQISVKPQEDLYAICKKREKEDFEIKIDMPEFVNAPIKIGDKIGTIYLVKEGVVIDKTNIISTQNVEKSNFYDNFYSIINNWGFAKR